MDTQFRDFEGERLYLQTVSKEDLMIHLVRYQFAMSRVSGIALDIACGVGYGAYLLCSNPRISKVVACDIDSESIKCAKELFASTKLVYAVEDVTDLSFTDCEFDSCVSLETLEHVSDVTNFFEEVSRVLSPVGTLVLSVPNRVFYKDAGWENKFHYNEMNFQEFELAVRRYFTDVEFYYQLMSPVGGLLWLRKFIRFFVSENVLKRVKNLVHRCTFSLKLETGMWQEFGVDLHRFLQENEALANKFRIVPISESDEIKIYEHRIGNFVAVCRGKKC
jgi:SAM-dependent methyltransferase